MATITTADIDKIYAPDFDFNADIDSTIFVDNRERLLVAARAALGREGHLLLAGGPETTRYDTDRDTLFRQESSFFWVTGAEFATDAAASIDLATGAYTFFAARLPADFAIWTGEIQTLEQIQAETGADVVRFTDELAETLGAAPVFTTPLSLTFGTIPADKLANVSAETMQLKFILDELRNIKTEKEVKAIIAAGRQNSEAHVAAWRSIVPGQREYVVAATHTAECARRNSHHCSFEPIPACAESATKLHYLGVRRPVAEGESFLLDAGSEWHCYASDITRTVPVGGKYSEDQAALYNVVLAAADACIARCTAGTPWPEVHKLMHLTLAEGLMELGILQDITPEEAFQKHVTCLMCPHGLGHPMGLDVHDVAGHLPGYVRPSDPNFKTLRCTRELKTGMVMTIEPGLYAGKMLFKPLRDGTDPMERQQYFNWEQFDRYFGVLPGTRIEDDILVQDGKHVMLTRCPRTVEDVEKAMA